MTTTNLHIGNILVLGMTSLMAVPSRCNRHPTVRQLTTPTTTEGGIKTSTQRPTWKKSKSHLQRSQTKASKRWLTKYRFGKFSAGKSKKSTRNWSIARPASRPWAQAAWTTWNRPTIWAGTHWSTKAAACATAQPWMGRSLIQQLSARSSSLRVGPIGTLRSMKLDASAI